MGSKDEFKRAGFALLRADTWTYLIRNTHLIIGRKSSKGFTKWLVDLGISSSKAISRQHALIIYNFEDQIFEIQCLSKRYGIKVDGNFYKRSDGAIPLKHRTVVSIGKECFVFLLPN
jgi:hypothetical protein